MTDRATRPDTAAPCGHPREPLSLWLDGEAGPLLRLRLRWRLARCSSCRAALAELAAADRLVTGVEMAVDPEAEARLLARARGLGSPAAVAPRRRRWLPLVVPLAGTAAVAAVTLVGVRLLAPPPEVALYEELPLFEEMELIAELDLVQHLHEIEGVQLD